ncbi:3-oxoadipate enol-lactonase 2 [Burkholderia sp. AD24]|nr:3-oxoadipate enol-lactonase 2 [Burkholderia sp. AD24]
MVNHESFDVAAVRCDVSYRLIGQEGRPTLVLANSLGTNSRLWDQQLGMWMDDYRMVCFEYPGHGSPDWGGKQTIKAYAQRLASLLAALGIDEYFFCGLSMGGAIGMELALLHRSRMRKLVLSNTAAVFGPPEFWAERGKTAATHGVGPLTDATLARWFTSEFAIERPDVVDFARSMLTSVECRGYAACCEAIGCFDFRGQLHKIGQPTLVIAGLHDSATTTEQAASLAEAIQGSTYIELGTAHIGNLGAPQEFAKAVNRFLQAA